MTALPTDDQSRVLLDVVDRLEQAGIEYMISGSIALSAYVRPRMTRDIDIVVAVEPGGAEALLRAFGDAYYLDPDATTTAVRERRLVNAIHHETLVKVDLVMRKNEPFRVAEFGRRRRLTVLDRSMWVVSPEDLLLSKLLWRIASGSSVQWDDAGMLAQTAITDWPYLERWAERLGLAATLEQLRS